MVNMGGSYHLSSVDRLKSWLTVPQGHGLFLFEQLRHGNCNLGVGDSSWAREMGLVTTNPNPITGVEMVFPQQV